MTRLRMFFQGLVYLFKDLFKREVEPEPAPLPTMEDLANIMRNLRKSDPHVVCGCCGQGVYLLRNVDRPMTAPCPRCGCPIQLGGPRNVENIPVHLRPN